MGAEDASGPEGDEIVTDAILRLHPMLQQALEHPLAKTAQNWYPERRNQVLSKEEEVLRQGQLFYCIDGINERVVGLWTHVEGGGHVWGRAGEDLMNYVTAEGTLLSRCGMLNKVVIALQVFAKTKLREAAKRASAEPFDEAEFERERDIHRIMEDLLKGIRTSGYYHG